MLMTREQAIENLTAYDYYRQLIQELIIAMDFQYIVV